MAFVFLGATAIYAHCWRLSVQKDANTENSTKKRNKNVWRLLNK